MDKHEYYELKSEELDIVNNDGVLEAFLVVGQPYMILIDKNHNDLSLYEQGRNRRYIFIETNEKYHPACSVENGNVSEIYNSLDQLLVDLSNNKLRVDIVDEIKKNGHIVFGGGMRC